METDKNKIRAIREEFEKRQKRRIGIFIFTLIFLLVVGFVILPLMDHLGVSRIVWAPPVYLIMFVVLISIGFVWRCPSCNGLLGDVFTTKYCAKCGFKFSDDDEFTNRNSN